MDILDFKVQVLDTLKNEGFQEETRNGLIAPIVSHAIEYAQALNEALLHWSWKVEEALDWGWFSLLSEREALLAKVWRQGLEHCIETQIMLVRQMKIKRKGVCPMDILEFRNQVEALLNAEGVYGQKRERIVAEVTNCAIDYAKDFADSVISGAFKPKKQPV